MKRRELLDIRDAAAYISRDVYFIRRLVAREALPVYRVGRLLRFDAADLDRLLDAAKVEAKWAP